MALRKALSRGAIRWSAAHADSVARSRIRESSMTTRRNLRVGSCNIKSMQSSKKRATHLTGKSFVSLPIFVSTSRVIASSSAGKNKASTEALRFALLARKCCQCRQSWGNSWSSCFRRGILNRSQSGRPANRSAARRIEVCSSRE